MRSFQDQEQIVEYEGRKYLVKIPVEVSDWTGIGRGMSVYVGKIRIRPVKEERRDVK